MENVTITETMHSTFVLLEVVGAINSYTYKEFESKIYGYIKKTNIVLELSRVRNLSSSGLGILMAAFDDGEETGHKIYFLNPSDIVKLAIDSTGFSEAFNIIQSINEVE